MLSSSIHLLSLSRLLKQLPYEWWKDPQKEMVERLIVFGRYRKKDH